MKVWYWRFGSLRSTDEFASVSDAAEAATQGEWGAVIGDTEQTRERFAQSLTEYEARREFLWNNKDDGKGCSFAECERMIPVTREWLAQMEGVS